MTAAPDSRLHVLVVDDDPLNLRIAARLLRELGHQGALVNNGAKAVQLAREQRFDLVLLDIHMPGLGGQDTLAALRSLPPGSARPKVLMVSGEADPATQAHFLAAGADGFLTKPLARDPLAQALASLSRGRPLA
ncbi:response regulator [Roseateles sp. BYS87W]|uniref:Response regulator n=1 Tax=Pelomonas baiyunensis TaxID=3299026 RepID=A0ABW7GTJ2_9BURK